MADNGDTPPEQPTDRPAERDDADAATIAELRAEVARLTDQWRRALADLDNYQKRVARSSTQQRADERARVSAEWLPVLDNLDLALEHGMSDPASIVQGIQAVRDQALMILSRLGYPRRTDLGAEFDPARHEAVAATPDPHATPGTVVQVVRPGYGDDEHQLRPASVVVATRPD
jgi:molecular chaperone GrpE